MALSAFLLGATGYVLAQRGVIAPPAWVAQKLQHDSYKGFMADWWAHNASYATATLGAVVLCTLTYRKRINV